LLELESKKRLNSQDSFVESLKSVESQNAKFIKEIQRKSSFTSAFSGK